MKPCSNISVTAATAVCSLLFWLLTFDDCLSWEVLDRRFWNANLKMKTLGSRIHVGDEFVSPFTYVRKGKLASRRPKTPPLSGKYPSSRPRDRRPWRRLLYLAMKRRYTSRRLTKFRLLYFSFESGGKDDDDERRGWRGWKLKRRRERSLPNFRRKVFAHGRKMLASLFVSSLRGCSISVTALVGNQWAQHALLFSPRPPPSQAS